LDPSPELLALYAPTYDSEKETVAAAPQAHWEEATGRLIGPTGGEGAPAAARPTPKSRVKTIARGDQIGTLDWRAPTALDRSGVLSAWAVPVVGGGAPSVGMDL
jgi:hypothetical protein